MATSSSAKLLPLSPMLVQYLVGLCALKWDANAVDVDVDVTLGDMVPDEAAGSSRDVDVAVKVNAADGVGGTDPSLRGGWLVRRPPRHLAERRTKDYVEWREHTDAAISGHHRGRERHVTRTFTSDYGMQR